MASGGRPSDSPGVARMMHRQRCRHASDVPMAVCQSDTPIICLAGTILAVDPARPQGGWHGGGAKRCLTFFCIPWVLKPTFDADFPSRPFHSPFFGPLQKGGSGAYSPWDGVPPGGEYPRVPMKGIPRLPMSISCGTLIGLVERSLKQG